MCNKRYTYFIFCLLFVLLNSCSEYQKVLKSKDYEYKYSSALKYFDEKKYAKAQTLFEDVTSHFRGTERSEDVLAYTARCCMGQKNYETAAEFYQTYIRSYPKGRYIIEARFMVGHAYFMCSPDARLDQDQTKKSIQFFTEFVELYPDSQYTNQAYEEMGKMTNKLAYKEFLNAKLYYNLGSYLGNNYLSSEMVAQNALKNYPSNDYQEDFNWLIFASKYQQMMVSFEESKLDRAHDAEDEYYNFVTQFPDSKRINSAERMAKDIRKILNKENAKEIKKTRKEKDIEI